MAMHLETPNRRAFELVTEALELIGEYRDSKDVSKLDDARMRLETACGVDPDYYRAKYYSAIVDDLSGKFTPAVQKFTQLLGQSTPLDNEVRYNLGLAEYHGYSHSALDRAIPHFMHVVETV